MEWKTHPDFCSIAVGKRYFSDDYTITAEAVKRIKCGFRTSLWGLYFKGVKLGSYFSARAAKAEAYLHKMEREEAV